MPRRCGCHRMYPVLRMQTCRMKSWILALCFGDLSNNRADHKRTVVSTGVGGASACDHFSVPHSKTFQSSALTDQSEVYSALEKTVVVAIKIGAVSFSVCVKTEMRLGGTDRLIKDLSVSKRLLHPVTPLSHTFWVKRRVVPLLKQNRFQSIGSAPDKFQTAPMRLTFLYFLFLCMNWMVFRRSSS